MKIIKNLFKPGLMLIFILFLASCQNEAIESDVESKTITEAKNWLKSNSDLPIVQNKFFRSDIDWDKSFTYNEKLYVPFLDSNLSVTKVENVDGLSKTSRSYLVFTKLEKDSYNLNLEIYFSNDFSNLEDVEILKLPYIKIDENNQLISNSSNSITSKSDQAPEPVCEEYGYYEISYDPNTGVTEKTLLYRFKICSSNWNWEDEGSGGGGGSGGGITAPTPSQIIDELAGKAKCIYEKLKSSSTGFENAIKKFDGDFPVSHLQLQSSSILPNRINAQTYPPNNYIIKIEINSNNLSRPNLSIARTIIHEVISN